MARRESNFPSAPSSRSLGSIDKTLSVSHDVLITLHPYTYLKAGSCICLSQPFPRSSRPARKAKKNASIRVTAEVQRASTHIIIQTKNASHLCRRRWRTLSGLGWGPWTCAHSARSPSFSRPAPFSTTLCVFRRYTNDVL